VSPRIHYLSDHSYTGCAVAGRRLMLGLDSIGCPLRWTPLRWVPEDPLLPPGQSPCLRLPRLAETEITPDVVIVHATPEFLPAVEHLVPAGIPLVIHTVWELDRLQTHWPELLNRCDAVVVPSHWNAATFRAGGVTAPILVVPHAHSGGLDPPDPAWLEPVSPPDELMLHTIADWIPRKAPWRTLEAYARAFGPEQGTRLVMRTCAAVASWAPLPEDGRPAHLRGLTSWNIATLMHRHAPAPPLHIITKALSFEQIAGMHARSGCWISLPHAEGWDLGCFDAAVAGCPVITTAHGGPLEYLDPGCSFLVPARLRDCAELYGATWAVPDVDIAIDMLHEIHADPAAAATRAAAMATRLRVTHAPATIASSLVSQLYELGLVSAT